jgi:hypothetical protein
MRWWRRKSYLESEREERGSGVYLEVFFLYVHTSTMHLRTLHTLHYEGKLQNHQIPLVPASLSLSPSKEKKERNKKSKTREGKRERGRERKREREREREYLREKLSSASSAPPPRLRYTDDLPVHGAPGTRFSFFVTRCSLAPKARL